MASSRSTPARTVADLGCSTGFLLEDLRDAHPDAVLIGVDMIAAGLRKAHDAVPEAQAAAGRRVRSSRSMTRASTPS